MILDREIFLGETSPRPLIGFLLSDKGAHGFCDLRGHGRFHFVENQMTHSIKAGLQLYRDWTMIIQLERDVANPSGMNMGSGRVDGEPVAREPTPPLNTGCKIVREPDLFQCEGYHKLLST